MNEEIINEIVSEATPILDNNQLLKLNEILNVTLGKCEITRRDFNKNNSKTNEEIVNDFLAAKQVEGCSINTINFYKHTLQNYFKKESKNYSSIKTEDLRNYLSDYQKINNCSKVNIDNIRRILSSFFSWLEEENYILKSPMKRIHKIKTDKIVKETYSDETLELLRDNAGSLRDLAIIDLLASSGMRIGELVKLNKDDIDYENKECIVFGKGNKERSVYFDSKTKLHLKEYIDSRKDENEALFVTLDKPHDRIKISGIEIRLRRLGNKLGIKKVHPHKFRRTMATKAIDKGMPIEQVQHLLGHSQIDTTMQYAMVSQNNVKQSHKKYIG